MTLKLGELLRKGILLKLWTNISVFGPQLNPKKLRRSEIFEKFSYSRNLSPKFGQFINFIKLELQRNPLEPLVGHFSPEGLATKKCL